MEDQAEAVICIVQRMHSRTLTGIDLKSRIAVVADTAFDDDFYTDRLKASVTADLRRLAEGR